MKTKGIITFSGVDCCGKSTQIDMLCDKLSALEIKHCVEGIPRVLKL